MAFLDSIKAFGQDIQKTLFGTSNKFGGTSNSPLAYKPPQPSMQQANISTPTGPKFVSATPTVKIPQQTVAKPVQTSVNTVNASALNQPVQDFSFQETTTFNDGFNTTANRVVEQAKTKPDPRNDALSRITGLIEQQGKRGERETALQEEFGLTAKQEQLNKINAQALEVDRAYEKQIRELRKNAEGKTTGALNNQINQVSRARNEELADIGIQQAVAQGSVDSALNIIKTKVDAEFEPIANQIDSLKTYYSLYQNDLSDSEKMQLESSIAQQEAEYKAGYENSALQQSASVWQQMVDAGNVEWKDVPQDVIPYMNATAKSKYTSEIIDPLIDKASQISGLLTNTGISGAVGANVLSRISPLKGISGKTADFISKVEQLTSQETLDTLINLKAKGGTLGALSDDELAMLKSSASTIASRAIQKDGRVVGYEMSESSFKEELKRLETVTNRALLKADIVPVEKKEEILIREMIKKYPTDSAEKIQERVDLTLPQYTSFNSAGNASVSTIANAIKKVESQGNYNAKGASGEFGAYQFMPTTWKQWAGQFLGDPNAKPTPQNQDFVAQSKINELVSKGYNPEQIALIWNGGTPVRKAGVNKFGVKYDSGAYADKVLRNLT